MVTATLTSKGQITIPKPIRDSLNLRTGDRLAFVMHGPSEAVLKPITKSVDQVFGLLHRPKASAVSVDDMNRAIARRMRKHRP